MNSNLAIDALLTPITLTRLPSREKPTAPHQTESPDVEN